MKRIVSIGECMVELSPSMAPYTYCSGFAGDTLNTAWYLRRLLGPDWQVDYLTAIGCDTLSDRMLTFLDVAGIGTKNILRRDNATVGLYLIELAEGERSFMYWRGQSAARTLARDEAPLVKALEGASVAYLSGITIAILPAPDRARLFDVLQRFRDAGGHVAFDPNLRPKLWASPKEMTDAISRAGEVADTVFPSFEDEGDWFGDAAPEATAARYAALGAGTVIVKNGAGTVVALHGSEQTLITPMAVDSIVDTTAAGDSFNAGYLAAHLAGAPLAECVQKGATLAAKVIARPGALVDII